jgi:hypothetical protein
LLHDPYNHQASLTTSISNDYHPAGNTFNIPAAQDRTIGVVDSVGASSPSPQEEEDSDTGNDNLDMPEAWRERKKYLRRVLVRGRPANTECVWDKVERLEAEAMNQREWGVEEEKCTVGKSVDGIYGQEGADKCNIEYQARGKINVSVYFRDGVLWQLDRVAASGMILC